MSDPCYRTLSIALLAAVSGFPEFTTAQVDTTDGEAEGLDMWVLFGSILLFLVIVVAITLARRWR